MGERFADRVTVPDVVGMPFHAGRDVASAAGVALANPDPEGPPIGALAWPGLFYITSQDPAPGVEVYRWDSVRIEIVEHGVAGSDASRDDPECPPRGSAHASLERERQLDPTRSEDER